MNELKRALSKQHSINCPNLNAEYTKFIKNIGKINEFERPDGFIIIDDMLYGIEHFEFDSSKFIKKKGTKNRQKLGRIGQLLNSYPDNTFYQDEVNSNISIEQYFENLLRNYQNHYEKIDSYLDNIKKCTYNFNQIKFGFFVEDVTILGNCYKLKEENSLSKLHLLHLAYYKNFIDLFESSQKLDFCFCAISNSSKNSVDFINKTNLFLYREKEITYSQIELINFRTRTTGININLSSLKYQHLASNYL